MYKINLLKIICLLAILQCSEQSPLPRDELIGYLNSRLSYYGQRFERIMKTLDPVFTNEMRALMDEFNAARESTSLKVKEKILDNYTKQLTVAFNEELKERLEEQVLNEEILMERWYFEQMLPQLSPELAEEVAAVIPLFTNALAVKELDEKYDAFANIEDGYSKELLAILDTEPESKEVMNVHLIFFKEFLQYLLDHSNDADFGSSKYVDKIQVLLEEVEGALENSEMKPKYKILDSFDSLENSFGRFLNYKLTEFEVYKHGSTGKRFISNDCIGVYRRYHLCNDQPCAKNVEDFRALQCASFNDVAFQGRKYNWEPYIKDDAECELNCKPVGMKYFATLNNTVIDGTPCSRPAEYYRSHYRDRAICVGGICKAIHASGVITGLSANSGAVACGGLLCRPITGIFTRDPLPEDAYVHVASIPAGASNISITELKNSINLLVLRTEDQKYIFNGDNSESESGAYEAAGAVFDYHRIDGLQHGDGVTEWISCTGPIREMLELMVYSKTINPGIKYEYLLPIASDSEENELSVESDGFLKSAPEDSSLSSSRSTRRRRFNWKVVGFSACSKSCGGGTQTPVIRCVRENPVRYFSQRRCMHSEKPVINENLLRCNTQPCPAYWRLDEWGDCRCHQGEGVRKREVSCVQELASGIVIHVDSAACMEEEPPSKKPCDCPKNRRRTHSRYRTHTSNGTHSRHRDKSGIWLMSEWNKHCSADCGGGVEYRTIFCDRSKPNTDRCDQRNTPDITRLCGRERVCEKGDWFAGPWSSCNGNCFNLTRSRQVLCIHNQLIVDDEDCRPELRPSSLEKCQHDDIEYCAPRWHYSEWSECTKACDGGTQRRTVKCLEYDERDNTLRDSTICRYSQREPIYRSCNTHKCDEPRIELLQNDVAPTCVDDFSNCQWAVKAKLCSYEYYQQNCCYSCGMADG